MQVNKEISVITLHNNDGRQVYPVPMKFEVIEDGEKKSFKIQAAKMIQEENHGRDCTIFRYKCKFIDGDVEKICEMQFDKQKTKWTLTKI